MLLHAVEHLAAAGRVGELPDLLSPAWMAATWNRFSSYASLVHDLDLAARATVDADPSNLAGVARFAVGRQTVRELMLGFPAELLEVWVRFGMLDSVLSVLTSVTETAGRAAEPLTRVAAALLRAAADGAPGDMDVRADLAADLLGRAIGMLPLIRSASGKISALSAIVSTLAAGGGLAEERRQTLLRQTRDYAETEFEPGLRAATLGLVAGVFASSPADRPQAALLLEESARACDAIEFLPDRMVATAYTLQALGRLGADQVCARVRTEFEQADDPFEPSSLDKVPLRTLIGQWKPGQLAERDASVELLREIGRLGVQRGHGFVVGHVVNALFSQSWRAMSTALSAGSRPMRRRSAARSSPSMYSMLRNDCPSTSSMS